MFTGHISSGVVDSLSAAVASNLNCTPCALTRELALVGLKNEVLVELKKNAPKKRNGAGNRPHIDKAVLLHDVAMVHAHQCGGDPQAELKKINGYREERSRIRHEGPLRPPVEVLARAVCQAMGRRPPASLRRQAARAMAILNG